MMDEKLINMKREILELKTAQTRPATFQTYHASAQMAAGQYGGFYFWRITYQDVGDTNAPLTYTEFGSEALRLYNAGDNTQELEIYYDSKALQAPESFRVFSTRPIQKIEQITQPGPIQQWYQVRNFDPSAMGTTPGWCLQNCRLGFGGPYGNFASARADMESQRANGTLHAEIYPPDYLAVPVYIDNGSLDGHVGVWDHGTFYSDGYIINDFVSYYGEANIYGWGELCDGWRVVEHT